LKPASDLMSTSVRDAYRRTEFRVADRRFPQSVRVELASAWIDRLYGPETTRAVGLAGRTERVNQRRAKAHATNAGF